jgi:hypothetical protein
VKLILEQFTDALPFVFSLLIDVLSPTVSAHYQSALEKRIENNLSRDEIGRTAKVEVNTLAVYLSKKVQVYTAAAITFLSGLYQLLLVQDVSSLFVIGVIVFSVLTVAAIVQDKSFQDPFIHRTVSERIGYSPYALVIIVLDSVFILLIITL